MAVAVIMGPMPTSVALSVGAKVVSPVAAALSVTGVLMLAVMVMVGPMSTSVVPPLGCALISTMAVTVAATELSTVESISAVWGAVGNWVQPAARVRLTARQRVRKVLIVDKSFLLILT
jgi:hypothetical protein